MRREISVTEGRHKKIEITHKNHTDEETGLLSGTTDTSITNNTDSCTSCKTRQTDGQTGSKLDEACVQRVFWCASHFATLSERSSIAVSADTRTVTCDEDRDDQTVNLRKHE